MATIKVNGTDRSTNYTPTELGAIELRFTATDGEVGQGAAPIPDPAGTQSPYAGESFQFLVGATLVLDGFVGPLQRERGESATGTRLLNTYTIGDENAVLHGFRAYRWARPSESTRTRFLAFLAAFVPWVTDTTWVTSGVTATMAAKTYTTETLFDEMFNEIRDLTGNTAFVETHRGHLHPPTVGIAGTIAFSDTSFDLSGTFPVANPRRSKDPLDLRNDVMVLTPGGNATATDATAITRYDAGGLKHQALIDLGTGTVADATAKAAAILADSKAERIMYEFDVAVPMTATQLAAIPVGCLINVTSAVLGLSSSTQRIAALTAKYRHPNLFDVHIECSYPVRIRVRPKPTAVSPTAALDAAVNALTAQAVVQACGSALTLTTYKRTDIEGVPGAWAAGALTSGVNCELLYNQSWPGTACGIGGGAQYDHGDVMGAWTFTAPSDANQIYANVSLAASPWGNPTTCPGLGHVGDLICGTVPIKQELLIYTHGGSTPLATDLTTQSGVRSIGAGNNLLIPRSFFSFGGGNRIVVAPAQHVNTDYACITDILNTGINDTGMYVTPTVQFYCLVAGTYGWIDAAPVEAFNGTRTLFTLIGGYKTVASAILNGVILAADAFTATDGSTVTTLGWAPIATDMLTFHYYIPQ